MKNTGNASPFPRKKSIDGDRRRSMLTPRFSMSLATDCVSNHHSPFPDPIKKVTRGKRKKSNTCKGSDPPPNPSSTSRKDLPSSQERNSMSTLCSSFNQEEHDQRQSCDGDGKEGKSGSPPNNKRGSLKVFSRLSTDRGSFGLRRSSRRSSASQAAMAAKIATLENELCRKEIEWSQERGVLLSEVSSLHQNVTTLAEELDRMNEIQDTIKLENEELLRDMDDTLHENEELRKENQVFLERLEVPSQVERDIRAERDWLAEQLGKKQDESSSVKELCQYISALRSNSERKLSKVTDERNTLEATTHRLSHECDENRMNMRATAKRKDAIIARLQSEVREKVETISSLENRLKHQSMASLLAEKKERQPVSKMASRRSRKNLLVSKSTPTIQIHF